MKAKRFNQIMNNRISRIKTILAAKGAEYGSEDRLHNFKAAAAVDDETPLQSAWGMAKKHLISVKDLKDGRLEMTPFMVDEKIGDLINYLILMEALMIEEMEEKEAELKWVQEIIAADMEGRTIDTNYPTTP